MTTLKETINAMVASSPDLDSGSLHRLEFWVGQLGTLLISDISADHVDDALDVLVRRGKLRTGRRITTESSGKPLSPATVTRYVSTLGGVYRWAKSQRLLRKSHIAPTRGVQTASSPINKNKFMTADEVDRLVRVARVADRQWRKLPCMITLAGILRDSPRASIYLTF